MKRLMYVVIFAALFKIGVTPCIAQNFWGSSLIPTLTEGGLIDMTISNLTTDTTTWRHIIGGAIRTGLVLDANTHTGWDGSKIQLNGPLADRPGQIYHFSTGSSDDGHVFYNYDVSTSFNKLMSIHNDGKLEVMGKLEVKGGLIDMYVPDTSVPGPWRHIIGNSKYTGLILNANTTNWDGAKIQLNGSNADRPGQIYHFSTGLSDEGHVFYNNPSGLMFNKLLCIHNNGNSDIMGKLYVKGGLLDLYMPLVSGAEPWRSIIGNAVYSGLAINANTGWDGSRIELNGPMATNSGQIRYTSYTNSASTYYGHIFLNYNSTVSAPHDFKALMGISKEGKVIIGADLINASSPGPGNYLLYVQKGILTERLKVANSSDVFNWSDFVFDKDYDLMPLDKVEAFIKANKHLPEIPTAKEVAKDGIDIAEMDAKLLQKIEELTLYIIKQQKDIEELRKQIKQ